MKDGAELIKLYKQEFLQTFGSLHCRTLFDRFVEENDPLGCVHLTARSAEILSDMINKVEAEKNQDFSQFVRLNREKVALGKCPFSDCKCA